jgi:hypothetical protein
MAYYTETQLINFFQAMMDDVTNMDQQGNITTKSGTTSPIENLLSMAYDREYEKYQEDLDWECTDDDAHNYAIGTYKEEAMYYLTENIETDDAYDYLDDLVGESGHNYININTIKENIFQWIGNLPIEWVHAKKMV